jgi:hypothetical protein
MLMMETQFFYTNNMQGSLVILESLAQQNLLTGSFIHRTIIVATLRH